MISCPMGQVPGFRKGHIMKRIMIWLMIATLLAGTVGLTGCSDDEPENAETAQNESGGEADGSDSTNSNESKESKGLFMQVDKATGKMLIRRPEQETSATMGEKGSWTIFVYLCGTDLESPMFKGGSATDDIKEMKAATADDRIRFVIQTGGTTFWHNGDMDEDLNQRFVIEGGKLIKVGEEDRVSMGKTSTLAEFLKWGVKNFAAEKMGVVLWDHGGGSIEGVCWDEYDEDCLTLREIDAALLSVYKTMTDKFEFVGMDACLMGTVEMANIAASYARYMYGSEEMEPGGGWDYTEIGNYLARNPGADGAELGKIVSDSYLASCKKQGDSEIATMSVIDLSKVDKMVESFNTFAKSMYDSAANSATFSAMSKKITKIDNFGGNNKSEGYTNMVDYGGLLTACADYTTGSQEALAALRDCVVYSVHGSDHPNASGLAIYYPLEVQTQAELKTFESVCLSPYYLSYVDKRTQGFVSAGEDYEYDDDTWFPGGFWSWLTDYDEDEDGEGYIEIGETYDLEADWDEGYFADAFDGYWLSLPDGQNLATYIVDTTDDYIIYSSPILLNDEETNLRIRQTYDGAITVEGAWDGIGNNGISSRNIVKIGTGDTIVPMYYSYDWDDEEDVYYGEEYDVEGKLRVDYSLLLEGEYLYSFCIDDIYGDYYMTDPVAFYVDADGEVMFGY